MRISPAVETIVIVGSGRMAPGIAGACAAAGASVRIAGRDPGRAAAAARSAEMVAAKPVASVPLVESAFDGADLVVETVVENSVIKRELLAAIEGWLSTEAIVTTNTSSISIGSLAGAIQHPGRFAGFHFLNPAHLTVVVEVVPGPATSPVTVERLVELGTRMGKRPLVLRRDVPGFIWNRIQFAVLRECLHMLDEGVADAATIDASVSDGLAPRWLAAGPLATVDLGGIDTFRRAAQQLLPELASGISVPEALAHSASGSGDFYRWTKRSLAATEVLRAEALRMAREIAERRWAAMPRALPRLAPGRARRVRSARAR